MTVFSVTIDRINENIMIRPLADRVVIEPKAAETQTASGLYIPDTAKEKPQQGTVVAAGPGKKDEPMEVKVGDVVIYGKYSGTEVTIKLSLSSIPQPNEPGCKASTIPSCPSCTSGRS